MIDFYYWPTPNGHKISIALEEMELPYRLIPLNIHRGEQFTPEYLAINPNNRIPAIVDTDGAGGSPIPVFESAAVLMYLAEKSGRFWPEDIGARYNVIKWVVFQAASLGPMFGQCGHFLGYAPEPIPYAINRYQGETLRIYGLLDRELARKPYIAGDDYSLADMATYPWMMPRIRELHQIDVSEFPHVEAWINTIAERPAVVRGTSLLTDQTRIGNPDEETRKHFFNHGPAA